MNYILAAVPLLIPTMTAIGLLENPQALAERWLEHPFSLTSSGPTPSVSSQLLAYSTMGIFGYLLTNRLIPNIKVRLQYDTLGNFSLASTSQNSS